MVLRPAFGVAAAACAAAGAAVVAVGVFSEERRAQTSPQQEVHGPARLALAHAGAVWTIRADGSGRRRLAPGTDPAWSPDGQSLAFVRTRSEQASIWMIRADGSGARQLATDVEGSLGDPAWSPDGSQLAFSRAHAGRSGLTTSIDVVGRDGGGRRTVISHVSRETLDSLRRPVWSPDGGGIAYTRSSHVLQGKYRFDIRLVGSDGRGDRLLLRDAAGGAWSPDGRRFAYGDMRGQGEVCGHDECYPAGDLAVAAADGSNARVLLRTPTDESDPSWSGDGRRIAFSSGRNVPDRRFPPAEIYSIAADGSCLTWLTNGTPPSTSPSWSPSSGRSEPGRCGAAGRRPRVDVRPTAAHRPSLWLGPRFGRLLLDHVSGSGRNTLFAYGDCASFEPVDCPREFLLDQMDTCRRGPELPFVLRSVRSIRWIRGALVARRSNDFRDVIIAGRTWIHVQSETAARPPAGLLHRIARALRPVGGGRIVRFPRPVLPAKLHVRLPAAVRPTLRRCHADRVG